MLIHTSDHPVNFMLYPGNKDTGYCGNDNGKRKHYIEQPLIKEKSRSCNQQAGYHQRNINNPYDSDTVFFHFYDIISTHVFVITNKRLIIATKRVLFGYFLYSITPDMFNDLTVYSGLIWGKVQIDTIKEVVFISNLSKKSLDEIETSVTEYMMKEKKKYARREKEEK